MSERCKLQKEYFQECGNYKGKGKYSDDYVKWLENKVLLYKKRKNLYRKLAGCYVELISSSVYNKN